MSVWFVTGASRGFGAEIVKEALARGNQVAARAVFDTDLAEAAHPPLRIQLGAELERWRKVSLSTDHEDVPHA
jgi:NAD(P)-dependent dehydrogenase (short-subunit alcohol dehydrogenase family)